MADREIRHLLHATEEGGRAVHGGTLTTVAAILANPRYTGRQVWNRQHTDHHPPDQQRELFRQDEMRRWTPSAHWVISQTVVHPPLVSEEHFVRAQAVHTAPAPADGTPRTYLLAGLVYCGICGRLTDAHWVHHRPGHRCRHGHRSTQPNSTTTRPKTLYVREDHLLTRISQNTQLRHRFGELRDPTGHAVARFLRTHNMIIVCDHTTRTIESDTTRIELTATAMTFKTPTVHT